MITLTVLRAYNIADLQISNMGHVYITMVVAFLLVSRVNTSYARYNESRGHLSTMYKEVRELINTMAAVTEPKNNTKSSKEWRLEVAYRTCILLRTTMAVIDYPEDVIPAWKLEELNGAEREDILNNTYLDARVAALRMEKLSEFEESMRVPIRISYLLRKSIHSHVTRLKEPMHIALESRLLGAVDSFMTGFYGMRKFLTTPVPFPMVQMARTFLFCYVFTIPFTFLSDNVASGVYHTVAVFIITYGFLGLETCAIELDNPFGADPNDLKYVLCVCLYAIIILTVIRSCFPIYSPPSLFGQINSNLALAHTCIEDVYLTILDVDGLEFAGRLRQRMHLATDNDGENLLSMTERDRLLGGKWPDDV